MTDITIRSASPADAEPVTALVRILGYTGDVVRVATTLERLACHPDHVAVVADGAQGVVALLTVIGRPSIGLQGMVGVITELVVRPDCRGRGVGQRLVQHAKSLVAARGFVRLEIAVPVDADETGGSFLFRAGFESGDERTYRWSAIESKHPRLPAFPERWSRRGLA